MSTPHPKALRAFVHVIDEGALSGAARRMNLSQPAVSRLIAMLEANLGVPLFRRDRRHLSPTLDGDALYPEAQRILAAFDALPDIVQRTHAGQDHPVRIACQFRFANGFAVPAIAHAASAHPELRVALDVHPRRELPRRILRDGFDIAIAVVPLQMDGVQLLGSHQVEQKVLLPAGHPLAGPRDLRPEDLENETYIALSRGLMGRDLVDRALEREGTALTPHHEVSSTGAAHRLVAAGMGFTFSDGVALEPELTSATVLVPWSVKVSIEVGLYIPARPDRENDNTRFLIDEFEVRLSRHDD